MKQNKNKKSAIKNFLKKFSAMLAVTSIVLLTFASFNSAVVYAKQFNTGTGSGGGTQTPATPTGGQMPTTTTKPPTPGTATEVFVTPVPKAGNYGTLPSLKQTTAPGMLKEFVNGIFKNLKYILGAMAVLFIIISAVKLIVAGDNEEIVGKQKLAITYAIIGLVVIGFADEFGKVLTVACPPGTPECSEGGFLSSPQAIVQQSSIFNREVKIMITFLKYLIGGIAVLMLVRNGIRFIALQGNEESVGIDKKNVAYTSLGLILIIIASTIINKTLFIVDTSRYPTTGGIDPAINPDKAALEMAGFTNLVVSFTAPVAILVLVIGAIMYATAGGNEETMNKAKRMITLAVIGMIIIYGAFAIISTIISGQFTS